MRYVRRRAVPGAVIVLALLAAGLDLGAGGAGALFDVSLLASCALALVRAVRASHDRLGWVLMGLGLLGSELANLLSSSTPHGEPLMATVLFAAAYPLEAAALFLLLRGRLQCVDLPTVLDGVITGLGLGTLLGVAVLAPSSVSAGTLNPLYPVLDLLIVTALAVVVALAGWRLTVGLGLALLAVALCAVGDAAYAVQAARGEQSAGTWSDAVWVLAFLAAALASGRELIPPMDGRSRVPHLAQLLLPLWWIVVCGVIRGAALAWSIAVPVLLLSMLTSCLAILRMVLSVRDVQLLAASRIEARTDTLTALPNRRALYERLDAGAVGARCSLLILDLDGFKNVNDSLGHHHGDALLTQIGPRLLPLLGEHDLLARLGGDEFAVVLPDADRDQAQEVARRLLAALRLPFELDQVRVHVEGSIGIASCPQHAVEVNGLMRKADIAMYQAKQAGDSVAVFGASDADPSRERLQTVNDLRDALTDGSLLLHYQPKCDLASGRAVGVEALVRWRDPQGRLRLPDTFLPLLAQAGLMGPLTELVLTMALDQAVVWSRMGLPSVNVAVNLPASSVLDASLPGRVEAALGERGLPGNVLTLEITEQSLLGDREAACQVLLAVRALGVSISIDDFGTGYSSLAYLRDLPIDELKLDKGFIRPMVSDPRAAALVRSTIDLTHSLGLRMVAEGVEDRATWEALQRYGCDQVQGFYLTPAVPADVVLAWLGEPLAVPVQTDRQGLPASLA
jgi:diguanylate cyclase (GGDEF)-like protein